MKEPWLVFVSAKTGGGINLQQVEAWDEESAIEASGFLEFFDREDIAAYRDAKKGEDRYDKKRTISKGR